MPDPAKDNANKRKEVEGLPDDWPIPDRDRPDFPEDGSEVPEDEWTQWTGKKLALTLMNGPEFSKVLAWFGEVYDGTLLKMAVEVRLYENS